MQQLSDMSSVPMETLKNLYYGKVKDPKISTVMQLSKSLNVTMNFLVGLSPYNEEEKELIMNYRKCGIHGRSIVNLICRYESAASQKERNSTKGHSIPCMIPIGKVTDGIIYNSCEIEEVMTTMKHADVAIEITTNFFSPSYCKGDRVLFESRFPDNGERAVFSDGEKVFFRKYIEKDEKYILQCLNGIGQDIIVDRMDSLQCMGTCIGVMRR